MIRGVGLRGAIAVNVITMIGIGPLITIPLVIASLHGGLALIGWVLGAIVALCDGLVWAELSSRYPGSGGTYVYLREAFGRDRWGRMFAFLFNWQFLFYAPILVASGIIGFRQYAGYFFPGLQPQSALSQGVGVALGVLMIVLLYRRITSIAKISMVLFVAAVVTLTCVIAASLPHANLHQAFSTDSHPSFHWSFIAALGSALYITLYDYVGYADAALIGDEVLAPNRTIPLAIVFSILLVAVLYIALQIGVLGVVPWHSLIGPNGAPTGAAQYVAATVVAHTWGHAPALIVTGLVLVTAFASLYGNVLGFSRIPYAAAKDGVFFPVFGHLHRDGFPNVALLYIGIASIAASFLPLDTAIALLTAGIVIIQGIAQIFALWMLRNRDGVAPFRMWLYPLPALIALAGWAYAFVSTGNAGMLYGVLTLLAGVVAFIALASFQRTWPFVAACVLAAAIVVPKPAAASYGHSEIVERSGTPVFQVDGHPFFVYAAAFFYERVPRELWAPSLAAYRALGINTIDLYTIWNWHELSDGNYDFSGRTNPRRDLHELLSLIHRAGFKTIIRPGPVIRNEWRNGGYPDWLLQRPDYAMPSHDILEGRYPATATLQNAHSDDAAAEWMHNPTHMRYAPRWLTRVLKEIRPWSADVIAVALDDDQGAYIDNQTWPAPHFHAYMDFLKATVQNVVGRHVPLFMNTYQMKVTASAPVWAWGNWYQSDALQIGEHDRSQLEFSTGLLGTQPGVPVMTSEFQAGWLQGPDEVHPRSADPSNTELALHTMLQMGAHGIVNFPVQDTLNPAGYEAPFANYSYAWDAAYGLDPAHTNPRFTPTRDFGAVVRNFGAELARSSPLYDAAIAYLTSAFDERQLTNADVYQIAAATILAQQRCRMRGLSCRLVDLRFTPPQHVDARVLIVPPLPGVRHSFTAPAERALAAFRRAGIQTGDATLLENVQPAVRGIGNGRALCIDGVPRFLDVVNYGDTAVNADLVTIRSPRGPLETLRNLTVAPRSAKLFPLFPVRRDPKRNLIPPGAFIERYDSQPRVWLGGSGWYLKDEPSRGATASLQDVFGDGEPVAVLANRFVRVLVSPAAGARAFVFEDAASQRNVFTSIGSLRDDVATPLPPSARDYIAKYTHQFPAGTFNRTYEVRIRQSGAQASATFSYRAPDLAATPLTFTKTVTLQPDARTFSVDVSAQAEAGFLPQTRSINAITVGDYADFHSSAISLGSIAAGGVALYSRKTGELASITWPQADVAAGQFVLKDGYAYVQIDPVPGHTAHLTYGYFSANDEAAAQRQLDLLKGR